MRGGPRSFPQGFPCPVVLWILPGSLWLRIRGSHPLRPVFPGPFSCHCQIPYAVRTPARTRAGLGSSAFARRYLRNRCFFLFLRVLRCFSSPGSPPHAMDSRTDDCGPHSRVSPFRDLRIIGYVLLPEAFRSLSRLSSALSAKASALCPSSLDLLSPASHSCGRRLRRLRASVRFGSAHGRTSFMFFRPACSLIWENLICYRNISP